MSTAGQFVISLDFELHWGVRDHSSVEDYRENLAGVRQVVPELLREFSRREIHATWATVGILFARTRAEALAGAPHVRPSYDEPKLDPWPELESAGLDEQSDPFHFAGSLVDQVAKTPHQELGTHSWSHFYCLEAGATLEAFESDIEAARRAGKRHGDVTRSIVFPRNQFAPQHLVSLQRMGVVAFRGNPDAWFWKPRASGDETLPQRALRLADAYVPTGLPAVPRVQRHASGLVDVPATRFLRPWHPRLEAAEPIRLQRILTELRQAARHRGLFHLWWHPHNFGRYLEENLSFLRKVLDGFEALRDRKAMRSLTMAEAAAGV